MSRVIDQCWYCGAEGVTGAVVVLQGHTLASRDNKGLVELPDPFELCRFCNEAAVGVNSKILGTATDHNVNMWRTEEGLSRYMWTLLGVLGDTT